MLPNSTRDRRRIMLTKVTKKPTANIMMIWNFFLRDMERRKSSGRGRMMTDRSRTMLRAAAVHPITLMLRHLAGYVPSHDFHAPAIGLHWKASTKSNITAKQTLAAIRKYTHQRKPLPGKTFR